MCIIAGKPYGINTLDWEKIRNCFDNNDDGAGFAFCVKGDKHVRFRKGFMTFDTFKNTLQKLVIDRYNLEDVQLLLHYRISTHGGVSQENTHPFPVTAVDERLTALKGRTDVICAMNGVTSIDIPYKSTFSDTMQYIKDRLAFPKALDKAFFKRKAFIPYITDSGAKWLFMDTTDMIVFGAFNECDGWLYSNFTHSYSKTWSYKGAYSSYGWYDEYYDYSTKNDDSLEFNYERMQALGHQLPFSGSLLLDNGIFKEIDLDDDVYIASNDLMYQYDPLTDNLVQISNIQACYNAQYVIMNYDRYKKEITSPYDTPCAESEE